MRSLSVAHRQRGRRRGVQLCLLALGIFSQLAQALLGRELLVVFYGNEVSLGAFFGSWLAWIGVGALLAAQLRRRGRLAEPLPAFRACLVLLPVLLVLQVGAARLVRAFLDVGAAKLVSLEQLLSATALITLPTGLVIGAAFPLGCAVLAAGRAGARGSAGPADGRTQRADVADVAQLYVLEAAGALVGGALFTLLLLDLLGGWRSLGLGALLLAGALAALSPKKRRLGPAVVVLGLAGVLLGATPVGSWLHRTSEAARFATLHPGLTLLDSVETRYGHVAIAQLGEQRSVVLDGRITDSFPDPQAVAQEAAYVYAQSPGATQVLLLGGVASGLAAELLRYPVERLDVVEEDERAFQRIRPHLDPVTLRALGDRRLKLHFADGRRFVQRVAARRGSHHGDGPGPWDLVVVAMPDPASAFLNRYYTLDFYTRLAPAMSGQGVLCTAVTSASSYLGSDVKSYSGSVFRTLAAAFTEVSVAPGDTHRFCASRQPGRVTTDPAELARRYAATAVAGRTFPGAAFDTLLPTDRVRFVRSALEQERGELNTDGRPVTYFLNMLLWGQYTSSSFVAALQTLRRMGLWTWLAPIVVIALLVPLRAALEGQGRLARRRTAATFALAVLGFVAMAAQLQLLLSYQALVGFVFGRIALLNGLFMTGLALGAGVLGRRLARRRRPGLSLGVLLVVVALACHGLPTLLDSLAAFDGLVLEACYLGLVGVAGLLTGTGFPLGVHLAHQQHGDLVRTSGLAEAADHLGGAAGGILAGAFLVPLLGVAGCSRLLAFAALLAMVPVVLAERAPARPPSPERSALRARGHVSFPFVRLSWAMAVVVLTALIVAHLVRDATGPTLRFETETLASVSGSSRFEASSRPMPHYLGQGGLAAPTRTVSLASMTVAADVQGYAGPINLLVAVDDQGVLRGVHYVESDETPAYIQNIDDWLRSLSGTDLSEGPLSSATVDVISGATATSEAALESINRAARAGARHGLGITVASTGEAHEPGLAEALLTPRVVWVGLFLLAFFPVYLRGGPRWRLAYQVGSVVILGFVFNTLLSEIDVVALADGRLPALTANPSAYLLLAFVAVTALLWGQVYCGYVCPFGALQELLSRLGRRLKLRARAGPWLDQRLRYTKFVALAVILVAFWVTGNRVWVTFNPMQHLFGFHLGGWIGLLVGASLVGALAYYRFWCRYLCPFGALLALSNKVALGGRVGPQRRIKRCDLGVRDEFDVDCIRCGRCTGDVDLLVAKEPRREGRRQPRRMA